MGGKNTDENKELFLFAWLTNLLFPALEYNMIFVHAEVNMGPSNPLSIQMLSSLSDAEQGGISLCNYTIFIICLNLLVARLHCVMFTVFFVFLHIFFSNVAGEKMTGYKSRNLLNISASFILS